MLSFFRSVRVKVVMSGAALFAILLGAPEDAFAQVSQLKDYTIHQHYLSPRAMGMGNTFTAVADDFSTLFYNPAGLARIKEPIVNLGVAGMIDSKFLSLEGDIKKASDANDINSMVELLQKNFGNHFSARLPTLNAFWVRPGWGMAIIPTDLNLELEIRQLATVALNVVATQDTTIAYGRGWDVHWLAGHRISMGVTAKAIYRAYVSRALLASDLVLDSDLMRPEDAQEGLGIDADFGMLWSPNVDKGSWWRMTKPTVGFTVRNVADQGFKTNYHLLNQNSKEPPPIGRRFDVGTMFALPDWWVWKTRGMVDIRDMGHENWAFRKGLHMGVEMLWKMRSWWQGGWRMGINQGYFTAGFTGELGVFKLDLVTTAEEVATSDSPKAIRKYMAKASLEW
jgi:hypothetical protein